MDVVDRADLRGRENFGCCPKGPGAIIDALLDHHFRVAKIGFCEHRIRPPISGDVSDLDEGIGVDVRDDPRVLEDPGSVVEKADELRGEVDGGHRHHVQGGIVIQVRQAELAMRGRVERIQRVVQGVGCGKCS